ncbi:MAG: TonB-dependent receptor [Desulfuromonadales bacterium]
MGRWVLLAIAGLLMSGQPVGADTALSAAVMDEVVVTATRQPETLSVVPANVTMITADQIRRSAARTVPELLRHIPGLLVNDIAGNGRNYTVDLRGFGETASLNTLVLIDGRRINQADLSGVDWTLVPLERVERIEIIRGARSSVLYGDNATAGVVNIITRTGGARTTGSAAFLAGSYDTAQGDLAASGSMGALALAVNGNYRTSDGYRDNSDTEAKDVGLNLEWMATERLSFTLDSGYHDDQSSLPGALTASELASGISRRSSLHPDDYADTEDWYVQGGGRFFVVEEIELAIDISTRTRQSRFFSFFDAGEYAGDTEIDTLAIAPKIIVNHDVFGHPIRLTLGFDYEDSEQDILNTSIFFGTPSTAAYTLSRTSYGSYAHADLAVTDALHLSAGIRDDRADFDFLARGVGAVPSHDMDETLYTAGINYVLPQQVTLYASYAKGFRYPVLDEMYNFFDNTVNTELDAQTSDDFEVGLRFQPDDSLALGLNLFHIRTRDEIFFNPAAFANENLDGDSLRRGVEFSFAKTFRTLRLSGSYTFRDTEVDGGQYDGRELPNVPQHQASLGAEIDLGEKFRLGLTGTYVGERRFISDFTNSHDNQEEYLLASGKLTYLFEQGTAFLAVDNLLDQDYAEYGALNFMDEEGVYPSPGIHFVAGINLTF